MFKKLTLTVLVLMLSGSVFAANSPIRKVVGTTSVTSSDHRVVFDTSSMAGVANLPSCPGNGSKNGDEYTLAESSYPGNGVQINTSDSFSMGYGQQINFSGATLTVQCLDGVYEIVGF